MKNFKYILVLTVLFGFSNYQMTELYPDKKFDEVRIFVIDKGDELAPAIKLFSPKGKINSTLKGVKLNNSQIDSLLKILNDTLTYGQRHSFSHAPSIGFVFYAKNMIIDWVELGFVTNTLESKNEIKAQWKYYEYYMGDSTVTYYLSGLSSQCRQRFRLLLEDIKVEDPNGFRSHWDSTFIDLNKTMRKY